MEVAVIIQLCGAALTLAGFALGQIGKAETTSPSYIILNFSGSTVLGVAALIGHDWGFLLLDGSWALISGWSLIRLATGRLEPAQGD